MENTCRCCQGNGKWRVYKLPAGTVFSEGMWAMVRPNGTSQVHDEHVFALSVAVREAYEGNEE